MSETKETKGGGARTGIGVTPLGCPIPLVQGRTALYFPTYFLSMQMGGFVSFHGNRVPFMSPLARYKLLSGSRVFLNLVGGLNILV